MTAASMTAVPLYEELGSLYGSELSRHHVRAEMLTHKWQQTDLVAPHSDLDIRIVLRDAPVDWYEWNQRLAAAHVAAVSRAPENRRLLEHPPGFAFTLSECLHGRISPPELATWSLIDGHAATLELWKSRAQALPWSGLDERFYRDILDSRLNGRYQLAADSIDNVGQDIAGYRRHCAAWHYLAPCWFAAAALATRTRLPGKSAALAQWRPEGLDRYAERFLRHAATNPDAVRTPTVQQLLGEARVALNAATQHVPPDAGSFDIEAAERSEATAWTMTAGMLRVRVARWLYYLDPPSGVVTSYLIAREAKELRTAVEALCSFAADERTPEQKLAARMAALIPTGSTTGAVLREALATWGRHHAVVEDFLTHHAA